MSRDNSHSRYLANGIRVCNVREIDFSAGGKTEVLLFDLRPISLSAY